MKTREKIMKEWDYWRKQIANGHKGSAPRDWFESILDSYDEKKELSMEEKQHKLCKICNRLSWHEDLCWKHATFRAWEHLLTRRIKLTVDKS
jgi:hypothetical protein